MVSPAKISSRKKRHGMSLLSMLFSDWWEDLKRPHRIFGQHFGLPLSIEDLPTFSSLAPTNTDILFSRPCRCSRRRYRPYERSVGRRSDGVSTIEADKKKFQVTLDVRQFAPEEVTVAVSGNNVIVNGKHEEKQDEHGWISRRFTRKYLVPEQCDIDDLESTLSSDGVLTIAAPRKKQDTNSRNERTIRIENTGKPASREQTRESVEKEKQKEISTRKNSVQRRDRDPTRTVKAA